MAALALDVSDPGSELLQCALHSLGISVAIFPESLLVEESEPEPADPRLAFILQRARALEGSLEPVSQVHRLQATQVATAAWNLCRTVSKTSSRVLLSSTSGIGTDPLRAYLQSLSCSLQGVTLLFPLIHQQFQLALHSSLHVNSYYHQAIPILRDLELCSYSPTGSSLSSLSSSSLLETHSFMSHVDLLDGQEFMDLADSDRQIHSQRAGY